MGDKSSVKVTFLGDAAALAAAARKAQGSLDAVGREADKSGGKMRGSFMSMGTAAKAGIAGLVGGSMVAAGAKVFDMAAQMQLMDAKAKTVFGGQVDVVQKWAKANAHAMGLTSKEAVGLSANFADLLIPMGFTRQQAAKMSTNVVGLSGALSQWSGGTKSAAEVSSILAKAMLGERDGLKELGISISDADVKARLLADGKAKLTGAALQQATAEATQALIMEKSTDAQTAYAKSSGTLAGQKAKLTAKIHELRDGAIAKLVPMLVTLGSAFSEKVVPWLSRTGELLRTSVGPAMREVGAWAQRNLLPPLQAVGGWIRDKLLPAFREAAGSVMPKVREAFRSIGETIQQHRPTFEKVGNIFRALGVVLTQAVIPILGKASALLWSTVGPAFKMIAGVLDKAVIPAIRFMANVWLTAVGVMVNGAAKALGWVPGLGDKLKGAAKAFNKFRDDVKAALDGTAKDANYSGKQIAQGLISGIGEKTQAMKQQAYKLGAAAANAIRHGAEVESPSKITTYVGKMLADGLTVGLQARGKAAVAAAKALAGKVAGIAAKVIEPVDRAIAASKDRLQSLRDSSSELAKTARDNARSYASILGFQPEEGKAATAGDVLQSMRDRLKKVQEFRANLARLAKLGLNATTYRELLEGGVEQGGSIASALLSGGAGAVGEANALQGQLNTASNALGANGANRLYGGQISAEQKRLSALENVRARWNKTEININVVGGLDGSDIAKKIQAALLKLKRTNGGSLGLA